MRKAAKKPTSSRRQPARHQGAANDEMMEPSGDDEEVKAEAPEGEGEGEEELDDDDDSKKSSDEPSAEELANVEKEFELKDDDKDVKKALPAVAKDLLSGYMEQLSHIPLFTPDSERKAAERLVDLEVSLWTMLLRQPVTFEVLCDACLTMEKDVQLAIWNMRLSIKRSSQRSSKLATKTEQALTDLATQLRYIDNDKELMELVVSRLRRSGWNKKDPNRIAYKDLLTIERSRGEALRSRNDFVRANLRLVVSVARSFHHVRLPFIDLIQEGNVGLMKAVHRYDHRRGFRFSTYAIWWIRQAIERAIINKGSAVRLPVHVIDSRRQLNRAQNKLTQKLGRAPTTAELSKTLRLSPAKIDQIQAGVHQDPVSLDDPISSDDPRKYLDMVRDDNAPALDESLIRENTQNRLRELLTLLSPIEKDIIKRRFGMYDGQDQTLDEIGKHYNLSRERVRQIQSQGLMKMRRMCERRKIGTR